LLWRLTAVEFTDNWDSIGGFKRDAQAGTLPQYSFIEPKYTTFFGQANDQHPPHDVRAGEQLIDDVYHAVRTSPLWNELILIVLYDEHGGLYDHVLPPAVCPPACAPDEHTTLFKFDRLGVRVPAVLISPLIPAGTIVKDVFDHSSVPATVKKLFGLPSFLTHRDERANTFDLVASLSSPRTDTPERFGSAPVRPTDDWGDEVATPARIELLMATGEASVAPISDLQASMVHAAHQLPVNPQEARVAMLDQARPMLTEHDAAVFLRQAAQRFRTRQRALQAQGVRGVPGRL